MEQLEIPVGSILNDETFRFARRDPKKVSRIARSIRSSGLLHPIWIHKMDGGYRILAGFSRLEAAEAAALKSVPALIVPDVKPIGGWLYQILLVHCVSSDLNVLEKARILKMLETTGPTDEAQRKPILDLLAVPDRPFLLQEVMQLSKLEPEIQSYIEKYDVSLKQASQFMLFTADAQRYCAGLGEVLLIRPVELLEMGTQLQESAKRDGESVRTLAESLGISALLMSDLTRSQKIQQIKLRILARRYPKLTAWNQSIEKSTKRLDLPAQVGIKWDRTFETPGVRIQADIQCPGDVDALIKALSSVKTSNLFETISPVLS